VNDVQHQIIHVRPYSNSTVINSAEINPADLSNNNIKLGSMGDVSHNKTENLDDDYDTYTTVL
jgi:hypothetical protein